MILRYYRQNIGKQQVASVAANKKNLSEFTIEFMNHTLLMAKAVLVFEGKLFLNYLNIGTG